MSLIGFQGVAWLAALVAGLLATIGAIVAVSLVVEAVQAGFAAAGRLVGSPRNATGTGGRRERRGGSTLFGDRIGPVEHSLLAREAWRLRC